jgi:hypothetical protein
VEVVGSKPSVDSSDEERLAPDFSTARLQTKKFSGAQRKRLTRGTKMKEGSWTDKKPPRQSPSQEIKRPDSD